MLNENLLKIACVALLLIACERENIVPKPRGYYQMDFPEKKRDVGFSHQDCPFTFSYPDYVLVQRDTLFFNEKPDDPCWLNIKYRSLNGVVHLSYKPLDKHKLKDLTEDYHRMKNEHVRVADFIDDLELKDKDKNIYGLLSDLGGDTASAHQFYVTDSSKHYVRGSLYFFAKANADSLRPASNFIRNDLVDLLESWEWE